MKFEQNKVNLPLTKKHLAQFRQARHVKHIREKPPNLTRAFELFTQLTEELSADERKDSSPQDREFK